ncbi:hypothetical protein J6590_009794 [Homalodisca vitripennis]|nr:hypothetical protein J6590_009794 [Homalodisca vitripennis]
MGKAQVIRQCWKPIAVTIQIQPRTFWASGNVDSDKWARRRRVVSNFTLKSAQLCGGRVRCDRGEIDRLTNDTSSAGNSAVTAVVFVGSSTTVNSHNGPLSGA